ncbi:MAG: hypothetical protein IJ428_06710, partial [Clostridia bacterium]|nr:hypothetical protein [Clostridia bacterium]
RKLVGAHHDAPVHSVWFYRSDGRIVMRPYRFISSSYAHYALNATTPSFLKLSVLLSRNVKRPSYVMYIFTAANPQLHQYSRKNMRLLHVCNESAIPLDNLLCRMV